ncbi:MAG: N-acetyltransferase family protein [Burkholderiaceae bacterium]
MDIQTEDRALGSAVLHVATAEATATRPGLDPRLFELRGEAMRRLFPKTVTRSSRPDGRIAQRIHAHLAEADTVQDLQQRLRSVSRYPMDLVKEVGLRDGRVVLVRPVLPSDAAMQRAFVRSMSAATRRNRFHGGVADLPVAVLRYMTEVDYVDHLALVGEVQDGSGRQVAEARWVRRGEARERADFAIAIADDCQHSGLGNALLDLLERSAAARGIDRLCAHVLQTNRRMIGWLEAREWHVEHDPDDPAVMCAELSLQSAGARVWRQAA